MDTVELKEYYIVIRTVTTIDYGTYADDNYLHEFIDKAKALNFYNEIILNEKISNITPDNYSFISRKCLSIVLNKSDGFLNF